MGRLSAAPAERSTGRCYCVFEKYLQDLSYGELADRLAEIGAAGVEATVRKNGHIAPERVADELPKMHEQFQQRGMAITMITTNINRADSDLNERVLRTAAGLGVTTYRMEPYHYTAERPVWDQLQSFGAQIKELSALNQELGVLALYQNHSGATYCGSTLWDIYQIIRELPAESVALAFDIRHAMIEAGLSWPTLHRLVRGRIGALYVKDFRWNGRRVEHAPLGTTITKEDLQRLVAGRFDKPISVHVEYLRQGGTEANLAANARDLALLKQWIGG